MGHSSSKVKRKNNNSTTIVKSLVNKQESCQNYLSAQNQVEKTPISNNNQSNTIVNKEPVKAGKIVVGLYDYQKRAETDINVSVGQLFTVLNDSDANWWLVQDSTSGTQGYVPSNYVTEKKDNETNDSWLYDNVDRLQAENLLTSTNESGVFLIRKGDKSATPYTLSLLDDNLEIRHYRIHFSEATGYNLGNSTSFKTLEELVEYYKTDTGSIPCQLKKPPNKMAPQVFGLGKDVWEIDRNTIEFVSKLGSGNYGEVWKGLWKRTTLVAVKTLRQGRMSSKAFLREANIMKSLRHEKLVQLLAVCTVGQPIYIVTEYMSNGALKEYLMQRVNKLPINLLISIILQVCQGMAYLESKNFIHRDLAARNVLVAADLTCKIADFGMTLFGDNEDNKEKDVKLPIKWTAPEAATHKQYSVKSDMWSFGVLMWEVFSFGASPYANMNNSEALNYVLSGRRLNCPPVCPERLYKIMLSCWIKEPESRPCFSMIFGQLESSLSYEPQATNLYYNFQ